MEFLFQFQKSDDPYGYLFAGLKDGTVIIFIHQSSPEDPTTDWNQFEILKLGNKKVCTCMQHVPEKNEVWVGCGNTVRIISVPEMTLDPDVIRPNADQENSVQGFAYRNGFIWCFVQGSPLLMQYNVTSRKRVDTIDCGNVMMVKGEVLSMRDTLLGALNNNPSTDVQGSTNGEGSETNKQEDKSGNDLSDIPDADTVRPLNHSATLPSRKLDQVDTSDRRRLGLSVAQVFDTNKPESTVVAKIHSIEVVKDTLWIGRDLGDVLVVGIEESLGYQSGQVIAMLSARGLGMLASPIDHLYRVGADRVVVCQELVGESGLFKHHVVVWKSWGTEEFKQFDDIHCSLEKAIKSSAR